MVEFVLLIVAVVVGLAISKALDLTGARGALPTSMQRTYDRDHRSMRNRDRDHARV